MYDTELPSTCLCMTGFPLCCDMTLLVVIRIFMMSSGYIKHQREAHALRFSVRCCSVFTVTTGTFDLPTQREITQVDPLSATCT